MELNISPDKDKVVRVGDILIFVNNDDAYMIIKHRRVSTDKESSTVYDLLNMTGDSYWTGGLLWSEVLQYAKSAKAHYSSEDYMLSLALKDR